MKIKQNPNLLSDLYSIFNEVDPQGLVTLGAPPDEYDSEIDATMERVDEMVDIESIKRILYDVFVEMFGAELAGTPDVYDKLAVSLFAFLRNEDLI